MSVEKKLDLLYEEAYKISFDWKKFLPDKVYHFHWLTSKEISSPVELQMGNVLPLVSVCAGPNTRMKYFTRPSVLNIFWMLIAASGSGKSPARQRFITEPLEYLTSQSGMNVPKFDLAKFTRAGNVYYIQIHF